MKKSRFFGLDRRTPRGKQSASSLRRSRHATFETLENRWVLSTLSPIGNLTLEPGGSYLVPVLNSDSASTSYTVTPANTSNVTASVITTTSLLKMQVHGVSANGTSFSGEMDFLLFDTVAPQTVARIKTLVTEGFYNHGSTTGSSMTFHRIIEDFMIQGGDPLGNGTGGSGTKIADEFSSDILFNQSGILAMANSGTANSGDSQFFITSAATPGLDSAYTIFGMLIAGDDIRQKLAAVQVGDNGSGETSKPVSAPIIDSMTVVSDTHDAVLQIKLASAATGTTAVTVTPSDGGTAQSFDVITNLSPVLNTVPDISTTAGTAANIQLSATDAESNTFGFGGSPSDSTKLTLNLDSSTGVGTLTPGASAVGLYSVVFGVTDNNGVNWATQTVPVFVSPKAPTSVQFQAPTGQTGGFTNHNNTGGSTLQFQVSGVVAGATVTVYADGTAIGTATVATGATSVVVTTNNSTVLQDGVHSITAKQTYHYAATTLGTREIAAGDLISNATATAAQITIDTVAPHFTSAALLAAATGQQYVYQPVTDASGQTLVFTLTTKPTGMAINSGTGKVTWTPQLGQGPTQAVILHVTDQAGNGADQSYTIQVTDDLNQYDRNPTVNLPAGVGDNRVTIRRHGANVEVFDNRANSTLLSQPLLITYSLTIVCADGVANTVTVDMAYGGNLSIQNGILVKGDTNPGDNNTLVMHGTSAADTFQTASTSSNTVTVNGLTTTFSAIKKLQLEGGDGNDAYAFGKSAVNVAVTDTSGTDTLDFSAASAGIRYSLGLDRGQAQTIAPWSKTLAVTGVIENLTGTNYTDVLTGGGGATSIIRGLGGNDTLRGGSRNSVLLGGDGNDILYNGSSNSMLIGGAGADTLYGGSHENILVGGNSNWDNNNQALTTAVQNGVMPALVGSKVLSYLTATHRTTATAATPAAAASSALSAVEDNARDFLYGGRGGHNWFLPGKNDTTKS